MVIKFIDMLKWTLNLIICHRALFWTRSPHLGQEARMLVINYGTMNLSFYRNKRLHLERVLSKRAGNIIAELGLSHVPMMKLNLQRQALLEQGFQQLMHKTVDEIVSLPIRVNYEDEVCQCCSFSTSPVSN
jgi:hypothetical protein